jgi:hypothetical protein
MNKEYKWKWLKGILEINKLDSSNYAVELKNAKELKHFSEVDIDITVYPYSKLIFSQNFNFSPLNDYWEDINDGQKSVYRKIIPSGSKLFGLGLGALITTFFYIFRPNQLSSIDGIVSLVGIYLVGKEMWTDLNNFLERTSQKYFIRWYPQMYSLEIVTDTTLSNYVRRAREKRFENGLILPAQFDLIKQSNAQTIRLKYQVDSLNKSNLDFNRIALLEIEDNIAKHFNIANSQIGLKITLTKRLLGLSLSNEFFQALDSGKSGSLNKKNKWTEDTVLHRKTFSLGRIKVYWITKQVNQDNLIEWT